MAFEPWLLHSPWATVVCVLGALVCMFHSGQVQPRRQGFPLSPQIPGWRYSFTLGGNSCHWYQYVSLIKVKTGTNYPDTRTESQVTVKKKKTYMQWEKKSYQTNYRLKLLGNSTEINKDFHVAKELKRFQYIEIGL